MIKIAICLDPSIQIRIENSGIAAIIHEYFRDGKARQDKDAITEAPKYLLYSTLTAIKQLYYI